MWGVPKLALWIGAAVVAAVVAGAIAWQAQLPSSPVVNTAPTVAAVAQSPASVAPAPAPAAQPPTSNETSRLTAIAPSEQPGAVPNPSASALPTETPGPSVKKSTILPQFDVVRVEPDGGAVIAGRVEPYAAVTLLDQGREFDRATADASGQFALVPKQLTQGEHLLSLRMTAKDGNFADSVQNVTVWVPPTAKGEVLVALSSPGEPTRILSDAGRQPTQNRNPANAERTAVVIRSAEVEGQGSFFATGFAPAGAKVLLYLNNAYVATVTAGSDNQWSLKVEKGMKPGSYTIRADQVEGASGKVIARAEAPFNYPAPRLAQNQTNQTEPQPAAALLPAPINRVPATKPTQPAAPIAPPSADAAPAKSPPTSDPPHSLARLNEPATTELTAVAPPADAPTAPIAGGQVAGRQNAAAPLAAGATAAPKSLSRNPAQSADKVPPVASTSNWHRGQTADPAPPQEPNSATDAKAPLEVPSNVLAMASEADAKANAVVKELGTAVVERGDSLWRISRKIYGQGMRYTQIYEANAVQIRNPDLIYPGQIFVVPNTGTN
jgi:nucleoid-associated protein YgaU